MRILLTQSGGFVGVPLRYEVEVSALDQGVLAALERALVAVGAAGQPQATSAGEVRIRVERDDGSVQELTMSNAAPIRQVAELLPRLQACARIVGRG